MTNDNDKPLGLVGDDDDSSVIRFAQEELLATTASDVLVELALLEEGLRSQPVIPAEFSPMHSESEVWSAIVGRLIEDREPAFLERDPSDWKLVRWVPEERWVVLERCRSARTLLAEARETWTAASMILRPRCGVRWFQRLLGDLAIDVAEVRELRRPQRVAARVQ